MLRILYVYDSMFFPATDVHRRLEYAKKNTGNHHSLLKQQQ